MNNESTERRSQSTDNKIKSLEQEFHSKKVEYSSAEIEVDPPKKKADTRVANDTRTARALAGVGFIRRTTTTGFGLVLALGSILAVLGAGAFVVYTLITRENPAKNSRDQSKSSSKSNFQRRGIASQQSSESHSRRMRKKRTRRNAPNPQNERLRDFYENQAQPESHPALPRGGNPLAMQELSFGTTGVQNPAQIDETKKGLEVTPRGARRSRPNLLDERQIRKVVARHYPTIRRKLERHLRRDSSLSGKVTVVATIKSNGRVVDVNINSEKHRGTIVDEVLRSEISRWRFPPFSAKQQKIAFPILLSKN